jgi:tetrapyrrole methylase family protein/MazG family protein
MNSTPINLRDISALVEIVSTLRGPEGCPWDKEQTHESLTQYAIEETHELVEALEAPRSKINDLQIKEELGDVLFQVLLHSQLAAERGAFQFSDVIETISEKLIRRHPHVFGNEQVKTADEVIQNWEKIKKQEKKETDPSSEIFSISVPAMPALQKAYKIGKRTEKLGFDWTSLDEVILKVEEEYAELREALDLDSDEAIEHELGDALFSLAQLGRHLKFEPEQVLRTANARFENRFKLMIKLSQKDGKDWGQLPLEEKEAYWQKAKKQINDKKEL